MRLTRALKDNNIEYLKVNCGYRWLVFVGGFWNVWEKYPYGKETKLIIRSTCEDCAVKELIKG